MMTDTTRALVARLTELLRREDEAMAEFLFHLAEFDRAQGWRELGYAGLFPFLERELGLSKSGAFFRMKAAQLIQEYPEILEPLRDGRLCLSTMAEVAKVLTPQNRETVLPRFFHRSKQQAKAVAAELAPVPDPPVRSVVTSSSRSAVAATPMPLVLETRSQSVLPDEPTESTRSALEPLAPAALPRDEVVPMTCDRNRLHLSVSRAFVEKLEAAKMALSHVTPGASMEQVFEAGLDLILAKDRTKKPITAKDLRICCKPHNQQHADEVYGRAYMQRFRTRGRSERKVGRGRSERSPGSPPGRAGSTG